MLNCDAFDEKRCASCKYIKSPYEDGLEIKINKLKSKFLDTKFSSPIKSNKIISYRNKAKFVIAGDLESPIIGIPNPEDHLKFSKLLDCPLHSKAINKVAKEIQSLINEYKLTPYNIKTKKGEFKYLIINEGHNTGEISLRFGMRSQESKERVKKLYKKLNKENDKIKVCCFEVQNKHAALFSGEEFFLSNETYITHDFDNIKLYSSSSNFFQVNSLVAFELYERVFEEFKNKQINVAVDLFCGVGGFAQQISRFSKKVYGIELSDVAIKCANHSVFKNKIRNINFICDDTNNFKAHINEKIDLIVVNPPRRGINKSLCELILKMAPQYLVYSSCNADSLKEDLNLLSRNYKIESMTPVDMFPLTDHLEVLTILIKIA